MSPIADEAFVRGRTSVMSLRDGSRVKIRPVLPGDKQRFLDGFARLSPASRYRRFLSPIDVLTPEMLRIFTEVDYRDHFAYVALLSDEPNEPGIGVALAENAAIREVLESMGARVRFDSPGLVRVEVDLPATTARLTGTPLYDIFRTVARGEGPAFLPPPAGRGDESP